MSFNVSMMRSIRKLFAVVAAVTVLSPVAASAAPFLYGASYLGGEIFSFDLATNAKTTLKTTPGQNPDSVAVDPAGNIIYSVASNGTIHRFNPITLVDQVIVSGLVAPKDIVLDPTGTSILVSQVADGGGHKITRVQLCAIPPCTTTNLNGPLGGGLWATANGPNGLVYTPLGLFAVVGDRFGGANDSHIAKIDPITGAILAQSSQFALLGGPQTGYALDGLTFDASRNKLYASAVAAGAIYEFDPVTLTTAPIARFANQGLFAPDGLFADNAGHLYVASFGNSKLMDCNFATGVCTQRGGLINGITDIAASTSGFSPTDFEDTAAVAVPEPGSLLLLGSGISLGLTRLRRRRRTTN